MQNEVELDSAKFSIALKHAQPYFLINLGFLSCKALTCQRQAAQLISSSMHGGWLRSTSCRNLIMEKQMETTTHWGNIRAILGLYRGYIRVLQLATIFGFSLKGTSRFPASLHRCLPGTCLQGSGFYNLREYIKFLEGTGHACKDSMAAPWTV